MTKNDGSETVDGKNSCARNTFGLFTWGILGCHGVCVNSPLRVDGDLPLCLSRCCNFCIIFFAKHKLRIIFCCMAVVIHDFGSLNVIQVFWEHGVLFFWKRAGDFAYSETFVIP